MLRSGEEDEILQRKLETAASKAGEAKTSWSGILEIRTKSSAVNEEGVLLLVVWK